MLATFGIPLLVFGGAELGLRLLGFGFNPAFFKRQSVAGTDCFVANQDFGLRFFPRRLARIPDQVFLPAQKAPSTFRIFILGESAALGDPRPNYGAGRFLLALLTERFPATRFEVINPSMTAINSHVILPIAQECARQPGDLWIVYMGNNEMVGPFGAATVFGGRAPPLWLARLQVQARRLRVGQLLLAAGAALQRTDTRADSWHGMEMFTQNQVAPDGPVARRVYRNFDRNLNDILEAGLAAHAQILLSTVAVNLRDCPPFGSAPSTDLPPGDRASFDERLRAGASARAEGRVADALPEYERASRLHPQSAAVQFDLATVLFQLTNAAAARPHFERALDCDTLPFRANSQINDRIRTAARRFAGQPVVLCDAIEAMGAISPGGIPGDEVFYEHVHFNPAGNYALALAWARQIEGMLAPERKQGARPAWASATECAQWLGLTDWNRVSILEEVHQRIQRPPFNQQSGHTQRVERVRQEIAAFRQGLTPEAATQASGVYLRALQRAPDDFRVHENYAEFLEARHDLSAAIQERRKVCELTAGVSYFPYYALGVSLKEAGNLAEAAESLQQAAAIKPDVGEVQLELGIVAARRNEWETARQQLAEARRLNPEDPRAPLYLGEVLWKLGRRPEALASLREAIALAPTDWQPHYRLASDLAQMGDLAAAAAEFQEALRLNPDNVKTRLGLAGVRLSLGQSAEAVRQLEEVLRLEPNQPTALEMLRRARGL